MLLFSDITDRRQAEAALRRASVSRNLVGEMLCDLQTLGNVSEGAMFQAGQELAARVSTRDVPGYLAAFADMGLGTLTLIETGAAQRRWTFAGNGLVESRASSDQPTGHYARGYLCGAVACVLGGTRVVAVEIECQSMGDQQCRFVVQAVG